MNAYASESGFSRQDVENALQALSLSKTEIVPLLAVRAGIGDQPSRVIFADAAMLALFHAQGLEDLSARLFESRDPGARRLADLSRNLAIDTGPRLERLRFFFGPSVETITFLCRKTAIGQAGPVLIAAALGQRQAQQPEAVNSAPAEPVAIVPTGTETISPVESSVLAPARDEPSLVESAPVDSLPVEAPALIAPPKPEATLPPPGVAAHSLQDVQRALAARIAESKAVRFLWRTDAEDRVTEVTPPLAEIVGPAAADIIGRNFRDVAALLEGDRTGPLGQALAKRETFSNIEVLWPITDAAAAVPVGLGALPAFLADRRFDGFRGFGVIRLDRLTAAAPRALAEATPPAPEAPVFADNVIHLRPITKTIVETPAKGPLSNEEETAFREIAAVLAEETLPPAPVPAVENDASIGASLGRNAAAIFDRLGLGIVISRNDIPIYANRFLLDLLGYADEDEFYAAGGLTKIFDEMRTGSDTIGLRKASGEIAPVRGRLQTIDWDGLPAMLLTLRSDDEKAVRGKLESEMQALKSETDELSAILDTATDGLVLIDAQGRIQALNRSAEALFGYDQSAVVNAPFTMLFAPESEAMARQYFEGLQSGGVATLLNDGREILGKARQGGTIPIFLTLGRIGASQGKDQPVKYCALLRDMTHWKKVEAELDAARREAERASALKSDFLAKVSHEVRTPLNAIIGFAEVIMEERFGPIGNERYRDYLGDIHASGVHVMSLVNDLLDLSKIEAGRMDLDFVAVDPNRVITECVGIMQPQANRERIIMRMSLAANLPKILADERSLKQIVLNLLSNAVKFNEPGGQVIVATVLSDDGQAVIRIKDTGIGMSETDIETALEPFRQLETSRQTEGTGLGLPLTKALVEANRASFTIKSKKNEGTLVEVAFPPARLLSRDPLSA